MLSDLIKVAIRAALLDELGDGEVLSEKDRAARCEYDKTVEAFERALTIAGNILRGERPAALSIPNNHKGALDWSATMLKDAKAHISSGNLLHLGFACRLVEDELRRRAP